MQAPTMITQTRSSVHHNLSLAFIAWAVMLAVSIFPNALFHELLGESPGWLKWAKMGLLAVMVIMTLAWKDIRPLRNFFLILLAIFMAEEGVTALRASTLWQGWFGDADAPFAASMWSTQL